MTTQQTGVSVTLPVSQAIERVKRVLFQPFDLGKWFVIGFCAWLAQLGESGGGGFNFGSPGGGGGRGGGNIRRELDHARDYVVNNLFWIVPVVVAVVILCLGLWVLFTWLNSRGKFMFLHCVALNKAEVAVPWRKFAREGNSLFAFRIVLGLIGMVAMLGLVVLGAFIGFGMFAHGGTRVAGVLGLIAVVLALVGVGIVLFLIGKFTTDFVVPIMFVRGSRCREGWGILLGLIRANLGQFVLYLLFQIVLALAIGLLVMMIAIVTCCCCCLLLLPYVGTVLLLPVLMFKRAYSLYYVAQFGQAYDVFPPPAATAAG